MSKSGPPGPLSTIADCEPKCLLDRLTLAAQRDDAFIALGRMFYLFGTPADARGATVERMASVESWLDEVLVVGRRSGVVRDDLPVSLQTRLVFAVLRALDEWTLTNSDEFEPAEIVRLARAELASVRRLLSRAS